MQKSKEYNLIPVVAMRGIVVLPGEGVSFDVGRSKSVEAIRQALKDSRGVLLVLQKDIRKNEVSWDDLNNIGTYCTVTQAIRMPQSNALRVFAEAVERVELVNHAESDACLLSDAVAYAEPEEYDSAILEALRRRVSALLNEFVTLSSGTGKLTADQIVRLDAMTSPGAYADAIAARILPKPEQRQSILEAFDPVQRLMLVLELLTGEIEIMRIDNRINTLTKRQIDKGQREYYLREKIRTIRQELGEDEQSDADAFRRRMAEKELPENVRERLTTEINRLSSLPHSSHEAPSTRAYIECVLDLPWTEKTTDNIDIAKARRVLDADHYGLVKVKERILEYLAVAKRTNKLSGQIICFVGPPGVGKTSISASIAQAIGRNFVRMSLGGIDDEADIRGHRRTYIGAMPGRIISAMRQAGSVNPVVLFDEIDKLCKNIHGDPAAAMLEVLDGAQNHAFRDHFLEMPYDLSECLFITTANTRDTIPAPLLDRMEIIEVPGYLESEKVQIAMRHLLPKQLKKHGLTKTQFSIPEAMLTAIINGYTRESGVREMDRVLASLCRKAACELSEGGTRVTLTQNRMLKYLGAPKYTHEHGADMPKVGICNGLAWTSVGGELLTIEAQVVPGNGALHLTGNLGDVMKESASAALTYIKANSSRLSLGADYFLRHDIHVHVPQGAIPKDGPSAGITIMAAMTSAISDMPVSNEVAMTGEITLRGRVLRIGGLREKLLAALRAGITHVLVPEENKPDILEIETDITGQLTISYVNDAEQVLNIVFANEALYNDETVDGQACVADVPISHTVNIPA